MGFSTENIANKSLKEIYFHAEKVRKCKWSELSETNVTSAKPVWLLASISHCWWPALATSRKMSRRIPCTLMEFQCHIERSEGLHLRLQFRSAALQEPLHSVSPHEQQMLLGRGGYVTISTKGEKHTHCASICAEKRKPGKQQIVGMLKALVREQQQYCLYSKMATGH